MTHHALHPISVQSIAVGSTNPAKLAAVTHAVLRVWPQAAIHAVAVESGVRAQPLSDDEAIIGAENRARAARAQLDADLGIGLEGNTHDSAHGMFSCAWVAVIDRCDSFGLGAAGRFLLPAAIADAVRHGAELGPVMDAFIGEHNTKQRQGAVGILSGGLLTRSQSLESAVVLALTRFITPEYYPENGQL